MAFRTPYPVRPGGPEDLEFLWEMLYEATQHSSFSDSAISRYLKGWGRLGDVAVAALDPHDGQKIGAAWYRCYPSDDCSFGFVGAWILQVAIAVVPNRRGSGVGRALLRKLLDTARSQGFEALSLSTRRDNPVAIRLYERHGFTKLSNIDSEHPSWTMEAGLSTIVAQQ
jgi:ribosomal protein S18 acetylase RimI-like enzyme